MYGNNEATNEKNDINLAESKYQIPGGDYVKVRAIPRFIELQTIENKNYLSLGFDYLSQKKKVLWKKHRTMIILRLTASGSGSGFEVYNVSIKNYQNKLIVLNNQVTTLDTEKQKLREENEKVTTEVVVLKDKVSELDRKIENEKVISKKKDELIFFLPAA